MSDRARRRSWTRKVWSYFRDRRVPLWRKAVGILAVVYLFSPVDFVPDVLPVIGWLDDLGLLAAVAGWLWRDIERHGALATTEPGLGPVVDAPTP